VRRSAVGTGELCQQTGGETWELSQQTGGETWELCQQTGGETWELCKQTSGETWELCQQTGGETWELCQQTSGETWELCQQTGGETQNYVRRLAVRHGNYVSRLVVGHGNYVSRLVVRRGNYVNSLMESHGNDVCNKDQWYAQRNDVSRLAVGTGELCHQTGGETQELSADWCANICNELLFECYPLSTQLSPILLHCTLSTIRMGATLLLMVVCVHCVSEILEAQITLSGLIYRL
jgi:hypothetical protein